MKKLFTLVALLLCAATFFSLTINLGVGGDFEKDATGTYNNAVISAQLDLNWFTAVLNFGNYNLVDKDFTSLETPEVLVGMNFRIPFWVMYAKTQLTIPFTDLTSLLEDTGTINDLTLHTKLSLGFKYKPFYVEAGASTILTPFAEDGNGWPDAVLPFVLLGLTF